MAERFAEERAVLLGTAKTHIAIAIGVEAAHRRYRVAFVRAAELVRELLEARDERMLTRLHQRYRRVDLLICDELIVPDWRAIAGSHFP